MVVAAGLAVVVCAVCAVAGADVAIAAPQTTLTITVSGDGSGVVTSPPSGIDCGGGADTGAHTSCTRSLTRLLR